MPVRWKRCVSATDAALGEALGKVYVDKYFAGDSKQQTLAMVKTIEAAMHQDLTTLAWMSPETQNQGDREAQSDYKQDRLPGQVARLLEPDHSTRRCAVQFHSRPGI